MLIFIMSTLLFIINIVRLNFNNIRDNDETDEGKKERLRIRNVFLENITQSGIISFSSLIYTALHVIVCSGGHFLINVIPVVISFILIIVMYNKCIKKELENGIYNGKKCAFILFVYIMMIVIACIVGEFTYEHPILDLKAE